MAAGHVNENALLVSLGINAGEVVVKCFAGHRLSISRSVVRGLAVTVTLSMRDTLGCSADCPLFWTRTRPPLMSAVERCARLTGMSVFTVT